MNSNLCSGDAMGGTEDVYQSWSPRSPDLPLGTSDPYRSQLPNQPTYTSSEAPPTVSQHSSSSYDANHVSYHNILCTNRSYCSSKCCEMQKRTIAKSSPVWKYFSLKEGDCSKAVCIMCRAVISRGRKEYTTSALLKHLRMKHGKCWRYHDIIICSLIFIYTYIFAVAFSAQSVQLCLFKCEESKTSSLCYSCRKCANLWQCWEETNERNYEKNCVKTTKPFSVSMDTGYCASRRTAEWTTVVV